ncbi:serine/threonine-protein kinase PBL34-like [Salvia divinorum]|uniref:Serine/threonine-protein kinase PBL34-like n=1 Tax=Salvia divinorum TaxID=28513 RepID=A0ABD1GI16_SALDI
MSSTKFLKISVTFENGGKQFTVIHRYFQTTLLFLFRTQTLASSNNKPNAEYSQDYPQTFVAYSLLFPPKSTLSWSLRRKCFPFSIIR